MGFVAMLICSNRDVIILERYGVYAASSHP